MLLSMESSCTVARKYMHSYNPFCTILLEMGRLHTITIFSMGARGSILVSSVDHMEVK